MSWAACGRAARPALQAPRRQSTAQVHGDRRMGRRLGSLGPRPRAAPRTEPRARPVGHATDQPPTWQVSHVLQPMVTAVTRPLTPRGAGSAQRTPAPRRHARRHTSLTWLRGGHHGQALGGMRRGPRAVLPRGLIAAVFHHLHVSERDAPLQQVPLAAGRRQGAAVVCGAGTKHGDRHLITAKGEVVAPSSLSPAVPSLCGTGDGRSCEHLTPEALRGAVAGVPALGRRWGMAADADGALLAPATPRPAPLLLCGPALGAGLSCPGERCQQPTSQRPALLTSRPHSRDSRPNTSAASTCPGPPT